MKVKEIVYCYVAERIAIPGDLARLQESFVENGFVEKECGNNKWLYKRGAALVLEFDYSAEAIEMQVFLEVVGHELEIRVGNWGFPFEPLMMKPRFQKNLDRFVKEISEDGFLSVDPTQVTDIKTQADSKKTGARYLLLVAVLAVVAAQLVQNT